jgi:hypothetical protein
MSHGYPLDQCGLYAMKSHGQLAERIGRSKSFVRSRARESERLYREWEEPKKNGGSRLIEAPREDLKLMQRRIADLLQRVAPPTFLFSPVKGKSYIDNAVMHFNAAEVRLLDIEDYFGRCDARAVFRFFTQDLRCEPDVAYTLTKLTTRNGHLPQGSPCSPILSFYSCWPMWKQITHIVEQANCGISVYVDDITISGDFVPEDLVWGVKQILRRFGHRHSARKERRHAGKPAEVTGVIVGQRQLCAPHRHYKKLQDARLQARLSPDSESRARQSARARSLEFQLQTLKHRKLTASATEPK